MSENNSNLRLFGNPNIRESDTHMTDAFSALLDEDANEDELLEVVQKYVAEKKRRKALKKQLDKTKTV